MVESTSRFVPDRPHWFATQFETDLNHGPIFIDVHFLITRCQYEGKELAADIENGFHSIFAGESPTIRIFLRNEPPDSRRASLFDPFDQCGLALLEYPSRSKLPDHPTSQECKEEKSRNSEPKGQTGARYALRF